MPVESQAFRRLARIASLAAFALLLAACAGTRGGPASGSSAGGYYMDDGPGSGVPADIASIADAVPRDEPVRAANSRPYEVFGQRYVPMRARTPYRETGVASWYGRKFHGNATASGERYDMYAMTAAHRTLPLPSYVRVTNLSNQRSVVVRVNDRGPFMKNRLIDLSWTAAKKLGFIESGHTRVLVELVLPGEGPAAQEENIATGPAAGPALAVAPGAASAAATSLASSVATPGTAPDTTFVASSDTTSDTTSDTGDPPRVPRGFVLVDSASAPSSAVARASGESSQAGGFVRVDASPPTGVPPSPVNMPPPAAAPAFVPAPAQPSSAPESWAPAHYLQLGAFESRDGALAALSDLGRRLAWLGDTLSIHPENGQFKIHAGPWADAEQARHAADRIRAETRIEAFGVRREAGR